MRTAVIQFPGSNCDRDIIHILKNYYNHTVDLVWHKNSFQEKYDLVVLPGGFSYGDYLRTGAMARFSVAMKSLEEHVKKGGRVLGICNGFQILTEANYLPGALCKNKSLKHICKNVSLVKGSEKNPLTSKIQSKQKLDIPISHGEGCYFAEQTVLEELESEGRILLKYVENPNGSVLNIAGICSKDFKITGLMPHPERAVEEISGSTDGKLFFDSFFSN
jgi:phosphoribosylformylglycinamidine synthase